VLLGARAGIAAEQAPYEQVDDREDHPAMIPAQQAARAKSSNRAPQENAGACAVAARVTVANLRDGELSPVVRYAGNGGGVSLGFGLGTETIGGSHDPAFR
jgi:hypothetical protein